MGSKRLFNLLIAREDFLYVVYASISMMTINSSQSIKMCSKRMNSNHIKYHSFGKMFDSD